jgi:hypothetical protein
MEKVSDYLCPERLFTLALPTGEYLIGRAGMEV